MKDSKEIVENILRMRDSDYELSDRSEILTSRKAILFQKRPEQEANVLPHSTEADTESTHGEEEVVREDCITIENIESYQPAQELHFEVSDVKDGFEKKKKRRNYIEFKPDYAKIV